MIIIMGTTVVLWVFSMVGAGANRCRNADYPGSQKLPAGETTRFNLNERTALVHVPAEAADPTVRALPLILDFHGWGGSAEKLLQKKQDLHNYTDTADTEGFVIVLPDGAANDGGRQSWNALTNTVSKTGCDLSWVMSAESCYDSCMEQGRCEEDDDGKYNGCMWATCLDDVAFVEDLIDSLSKELCIDQDRVYATGYSNGGLMVYALMQQMPNRIAAGLPCAGAPHWGFGDPEGEITWVPPKGQSTPLLHLNGISDRVVPPFQTEKLVDWYGVVRSENAKEDYPGRTVSADGWFYEPMETLVETFGDMAGCDEQGWETFDGLASVEPEHGLTCKNRVCPEGQFSGFCHYPKTHRWPDNYVQIVWEFARNYRVQHTNLEPFENFGEYKAYCKTLNTKEACAARCPGGKFRAKKAVCKPAKRLSKLRCSSFEKAACQRMGCKYLPKKEKCLGTPFSQS